MLFQAARSDETHWTAAAGKRLHTLVTLQVLAQIVLQTKFLLANVTRKPAAFVVRPQQVRLQLEMPPESFGTHVTSVWHGARVNDHVTLQVVLRLVHLSAGRTLKWPHVAVHAVSVLLQVARKAKGLVTHVTLERLVSSVDSDMRLEAASLAELFIAHVACIRFHSAVDFQVQVELTDAMKSLAADGTFKQFLL